MKTKILSLLTASAYLFLSNEAIAYIHFHRDVNVSLAGTPIYRTVTIKPATTSTISWIDHSGKSIPSDAVVGGVQNDPYHILYICRANYHGGVHPGKLISGKCNISWGGEEIEFSHYQVLVTQKPLVWVETDGDFIPARAIPGGYENGEPLYICQAHYRNGLHPGKVVDKKCNIGWGGEEIVLSQFNILAG